MREYFRRQSKRWYKWWLYAAILVAVFYLAGMYMFVAANNGADWGWITPLVVIISGAGSIATIIIAAVATITAALIGRKN